MNLTLFPLVSVDLSASFISQIQHPRLNQFCFYIKACIWILFYLNYHDNHPQIFIKLPFFFRVLFFHADLFSLFLKKKPPLSDCLFFFSFCRNKQAYLQTCIQLISCRIVLLPIATTTITILLIHVSLHSLWHFLCAQSFS